MTDPDTDTFDPAPYLTILEAVLDAATVGTPVEGCPGRLHTWPRSVSGSITCGHHTIDVLVIPPRRHSRTHATVIMQQVLDYRGGRRAAILHEINELTDLPAYLAEHGAWWHWALEGRPSPPPSGRWGAPSPYATTTTEDTK